MSARISLSIAMIVGGFVVSTASALHAQDRDTVCWNGGEPEEDDDRGRPWQLFCHQEDGHIAGYLSVDNRLAVQYMRSSGLPGCPNRGECLAQSGTQYFDIPDIGTDVSENGFKEWETGEPLDLDAFPNNAWITCWCY